MAGRIDFTLAGDSTGMVAATERVNANLSTMRVSVNEINAAFDRAATTALRTTNATSTGSSALSSGDLKSKSRALSGAIGSAAMTSSLFLGAEASAVVYPVVLLAKELKGLSSAMKLAGIGAGAASLAMAEVVAAISLAVSEFKFIKARLNEDVTRKNLDESTAGVAQSLVKFIQAGQKNGQITKDYGDDAIGLLTEKGINPSVLRMRIKAIQDNLRDVIPDTMLKKGKEFFDTMDRQLTSGTLTGQVKKEYDAMTELLETRKKINEVEGLTVAQRKELLRLAEERYQTEIAPEAKPDKTATEERQPNTPTRRLESTAWERIGLVLGNNGGYSDHTRHTAENTRLMLAEQKQTNKLLTNPPATNGNFSNQ